MPYLLSLRSLNRRGQKEGSSVHPAAPPLPATHPGRRLFRKRLMIGVPAPVESSYVMHAAAAGRTIRSLWRPSPALSTRAPASRPRPRRGQARGLRAAPDGSRQQMEGNITMGAAVANAYLDAIGVRMFQLPLTPARGGTCHLTCPTLKRWHTRWHTAGRPWKTGDGVLEPIAEITSRSLTVAARKRATDPQRVTEPRPSGSGRSANFAIGSEYSFPIYLVARPVHPSRRPAVDTRRGGLVRSGTCVSF